MDFGNAGQENIQIQANLHCDAVSARKEWWVKR
jgi:hypothetical protein